MFLVDNSISDVNENRFLLTSFIRGVYGFNSTQSVCSSMISIDRPQLDQFSFVRLVKQKIEEYLHFHMKESNYY